MRYALLILAMAVALPALAIDYLGTSVTLGWTQPTGPEWSDPTGWNVYGTRNGVVETEPIAVTEPQFTMSGVADETVSIHVGATLGALEGGLSEESDPITFRRIGIPGALQVKCPEGQTFTPTGVDDWWICQ